MSHACGSLRFFFALLSSHQLYIQFARRPKQCTREDQVRLVYVDIVVVLSSMFCDF